MVKKAVAANSENKVRLPFKILGIFVIFCFILVLYIFIQSRYQLLVNGITGRGTVSYIYYTGGVKSRGEDTSIVISDPSNYKGRGFAGLKFTDISRLTRHVRPGQSVPIVFYQDGNRLSGYVGTKTDVVLSIFSPFLLVVPIPLYFFLKGRRIK